MYLTDIVMPLQPKAGDRLCTDAITAVIRKSRSDDHFGYLNLMVFILPKDGRPRDIRDHFSIYPSNSLHGPKVTKLRIGGSCQDVHYASDRVDNR